MSSIPISFTAAVAGMTSAPPTVPSATPSVKTRAYTRAMSTPIASAISRFSAVARTMRPKRVRARNQPIPAAMAAPHAMTTRL